MPTTNPLIASWMEAEPVPAPAPDPETPQPANRAMVEQLRPQVYEAIELIQREISAGRTDTTVARDAIAALLTALESGDMALLSSTVTGIAPFIRAAEAAENPPLPEEHADQGDAKISLLASGGGGNGAGRRSSLE